MIHFWDTYLTEHFRQEEALLVAPLESSGGAELAERMTGEHRTIERRVEAMRSASPAPGALEEFVSMLKAHIRFEEREVFPYLVFPYLEEYLDALDLEPIGRQLHANHVDADLSWRVAFWD